MSATVNERKQILIGSDPELFLKDAKGNYVSAIGKFSGTKDNPVPIKELGKGFAEQVDNVLVEYNIPPSDDSGGWCTAHKKVFGYLSKKAKEKGLKLAVDASGVLPDSELADPMARVFGCDPDFNAWTLEINNPPHCSDPNLRSAGGHIHIGLMGLSDTEKVNICRLMDLTIGAWSVIDDPDTRRAELYGRPGAMRFKPYGLEYRTVSNFWLKNPGWTEKAWLLAYGCARNGRYFKAAKYRDKMESMFRNRDKTIAEELLGDLNPIVHGGGF